MIRVNDERSERFPGCNARAGVGHVGILAAALVVVVAHGKDHAPTTSTTMVVAARCLPRGRECA